MQNSHPIGSYLEQKFWIKQNQKIKYLLIITNRVNRSLHIRLSLSGLLAMDAAPLPVNQFRSEYYENFLANNEIISR
ncbi:hypothetical protein ABQG65_19580 [Yersinia alsatica]|uniref:hypothetical protein n=1 Tax=Yersinia alsatica TaxID=2890317 RepID=UPI00117D38B8